ncbi:MAG: response regulator [Geodermatophilaceae bacterium]|nr:response regulator [Geodermatophilaceae bacterium]
MESKLIQIVEDDADLALALGIRLRANGYSVVTSQDSITAVTTAKNSTPDLIILDLGLPGGDGFVFLSRLRSLMHLALIPVIVLTARGADSEVKALQAGARAFFQKPADHDALLAAVADLLAPATPAIG